MIEKFNREPVEEYFYEWDLDKQKNKLKYEIFNKVTKNILFELENKIVRDKETQEKINESISLLKNIDNSILVFDDDIKIKVQARTTFKKEKKSLFDFSKPKETRSITFYTNIFQYSSTLWIELILYHEFKHFLKLERLDYNEIETQAHIDKHHSQNIDWKKEKNKKEFFARLSTFRYYMKQRFNKENKKYDISDIKKLFGELKDEFEKKTNNFWYNEETQLKTIYLIYKDNPEKLISDMEYIVSNEIDRKLLQVEVHRHA